MKTLFTTVLALFCITFLGAGQATQSDPIVGTWKGTSICQVKNSPCNDETVVLHVSKAAAANTYKFVMNKVINNAEDNMGELNFIYDAAQSTLTCHVLGRMDSFWKFDLKKNTMDGTLTADKVLFRVIKLVKS